MEEERLPLPAFVPKSKVAHLATGGLWKILISRLNPGGIQVFFNGSGKHRIKLLDVLYFESVPNKRLGASIWPEW
jgi:hypothetical protein